VSLPFLKASRSAGRLFFELIPEDRLVVYGKVDRVAAFSRREDPIEGKESHQASVSSHEAELEAQDAELDSDETDSGK
jgi:hypothetical protein